MFSFENKDIKNNSSVMFMTIYRITNYQKHKLKLKFSKRFREAFNRNHVESLHVDGGCFTKDDTIKYDIEYDPLTRGCNLNFDNATLQNKDKQEFFESNRGIFRIFNSGKNILDNNKVSIRFCLKMVPFYTWCESDQYRVVPIVVALQESFVVCYELFYCGTKAISSDEIYGRTNDCNLYVCDKIKYNIEDDYSIDNRTISEIIFHNCIEFLSNVFNINVKVNVYTWVQNKFVYIKNVESAEEYVRKVIGANIPQLKLDNIGVSEDFEYYSTVPIGLVTNVDTFSFEDIYYDVLVLEMYKMYILLITLTGLELNIKLKTFINNEIKLKNCIFPMHVPIITMNMIDNLVSSDTYMRYRDAVASKIEALKINQEEKRINNNRFLNVLLYILALIGSIQSIEVISREYSISFTILSILTGILFISLGIIWLLLDRKG